MKAVNLPPSKSTPLDSLGEEEKEGDLTVTLNNSKEDLRKEKGFIGWSNQEAEGAKKAISELLQQATEFVDQQASRVPVIDGKNFPETTMTTAAKISFTQEDEEQQRYNEEPLEEEARPGMPAMTVEQQVEPKTSNDRTGNGNSSFNKSQTVWR
ncbi:hypothetical protein PPACK8108_LOCUS23951 [Phakopsora pachyrhizi]|uniref:Uncharacterized protein n=1 Tax=Phakopsora pachyrhizi TaxID=170000 RepID=A0AAV0BNR5_PHAPC|nr:hypothetical protein PPACK8108_LOCUS23951 [Phakopsora pachyrhizi]